MEDGLIIEIDLNGEHLIFDARLQTSGFVHQIHINVSGIDVAFEPDEERNYRAIVQPAQLQALTKKDIAIIAAIGEELEKTSGQ